MVQNESTVQFKNYLQKELKKILHVFFLIKTSKAKSKLFLTLKKPY